MIIAASSEGMRHRRRRSAAVANRLDANGNATSSVRTTYIGIDPRDLAKGDPVPGPEELHAMAFLVEQGADSTLNAHFHVGDQFQIFVRGRGSIANHAIDGLFLHFSAAYSPYGPIIAGAEGLDYLTLRNSYVPNARFMPACRDELKAAGRPYREVVASAGQPRPPAELAALGAPVAAAVMAKSEDGLGVWRHLLPPGARATGPDPARGGGQFWIVVAGALAQPGGKEGLPPFSCVFVSSDEPPYAVTAGPEGLDLLVAQFPARDFH